MGKFTVVVKKEYFASYEIEAEDSEAAGKKALEKVQSETPSTVGPMSDGGSGAEIDCIYDDKLKA